MEADMATAGYKKTEGFATIHGQMFEVKLAALLFLRATARHLDFQLAVNVDGAGALDDIVFRYKASQDGQDAAASQRWHTSFIQLKHKECTRVKLEMFTAPGGNFSLNKYLPSYMKIKSVMLSEDKPELFNGHLENCHLAIYTNAKPDAKLQSRQFSDVISDDRDFEALIKSGSETEMVFRFDVERDVEVVASLDGVDSTTAGDVAEFLSKLTVFCGQPSEPELDYLLGAEMTAILGISKLVSCRQVLSEDIADIVDKLVQEFHKWWSVKKNAKLLDQNSNFINQILVHFLATEAKKSLRMNVQFEGASLGIFKTLLSGSVSLVSVIAARKSVKLSCTKILQALHVEENSGEPTPCIFLTVEHFLVDQSAVTSVWLEEGKHCLCLVNTTSETLQPTLYEYLSNVLLNNPLKKCFIISAQCDAISSPLCETHLGDKFTEITDNIYLSNMHSDFLNVFLSRKLESQGHQTTINLLLGKNNKYTVMIDDEMVDSILSGKKLSIGQDLNAFVEEYSFYIPRTLQRNDIVVNEYLRSQTSGCILLSGTTATKLDHVVTSQDTADQDELRDPNARCTFKTSQSKPSQDELDALCQVDRIMHWFHANATGKLQWIWSLRGPPLEDTGKTDSPTTTLHRGHLQAGEYATASVDLAGRVVLVVAEPGMGKTTLLNHLALRAKVDDPAQLVIRVNLNDHTKLLADMASLEMSAVDFLMSAVGVTGKSALERSLFTLCFESSGNAVVLLDGFDEIAPSYCEEGCAMITGLLATKIKKVWITSRHSMREKLESHMSTIAFQLLPFSEADQRTFIKMFWQKSHESMRELTDAALDDRIGQFLDAVTISMNDQEMLFMGVPLQTMMLAEIFQDRALDTSSSVLVPEHLNLLDLFERFVEKKLAVFANKIFAANAANNEGAMDDIRQVFVKNHMYASLLLLLTEADMSVLKSRDKIVKKAGKFLQKIRDGKDKTGIIHSVTNGRPHFVHRTFAEYFTALWLSRHFNKAQELIGARLYETNFQVVRNLFDRLLAKGCPLHNAVLSGNKGTVDALIAAGCDINATDKGGRSPLHLAAAIGFDPDMAGLITTDVNIVKDQYRMHQGPRPQHFVEHLLQLKDVDISITDDVLRLSPLQLAFKTESWDAVEILLQLDKEVGDIMRIAVASLLESVAKEKNVLILDEKITKLFIMMIVVTAYGFNNFVVVLLDLGIPLDFLIPYENTSMITVAAKFGEKKLVELLLSRGANFTKYISGANTFPLHEACKRGHTEIVKILVNWVTNSVQRLEFINKNDFWGHAALYHVAEGGRTDILQFLMSQGVDIASRHQTRDVETALHTACGFYGQFSVAKILVESFGDDLDAKAKYINKIDRYGRTAIYIASSYGHLPIVDFLISHGSEVNTVRIGFADTALHKASEKGSLAVVQSLVHSFSTDTDAKVAYINHLNRMSISSIYIAAEKDFFPVVEFLVNEGGDLYNACGFDSALIVAAKEGRTSVINALLKVFGQNESARKEYINSLNSRGHTSVLTAAYHKHLHIADFLIRKGGDPQAKENGISQAALHEACIKGNFPAVKEVVEKFQDNRELMLENINSVSPRSGSSSLHLAMNKGFVDIAEYLIQKGCNIQPTAHDSNLHMACRKGLLSVAKALLERFNDDQEAKQSFVQYVDFYGESALHDAIEHKELVAYLIAEGAQLYNQHIRTLHSPLHNACQKGFLPAVKVLLGSFNENTQAMVDYVNHAAVNGHTPIYDAARNGHAEIVEYLIGQQGQVTKYNLGPKETALHAACTEGHLAVVQVIVNSFGINVEEKIKFLNALDSRGECALYAAASEGKADVVAFLAEQYSDPSEVPVNVVSQHSALHEACDEGHLSVVQALVDSFSEAQHTEKSAYINRPNARGFSAVYIAAYQSHNDIAEILVGHGGDVDARNRASRDIAFYDACKSGHTSKVQEILEGFAGDNEGKLNLLNSYNIYNCSDLPTPVHVAAWSGHADIVSLLIGQGCDVRCRRSSNRLHSLHRACSKGHLAAVRAIIDSFADDHQSKAGYINSCDEYGRSALFIAASESVPNLIDYLISQGGDSSVCDKALKQVALLEAVFVGSLPKVYQVLDSLAGNPRLKLEVINGFDSDGDSALMVAVRKGHADVVKTLVGEKCDLLGRVHFDKATILHEGIEGGKLDALNAILEGFGDDNTAKAKLINRLDRKGQSEFYYACKKGFPSVVELLRKHGGDINAA